MASSISKFVAELATKIDSKCLANNLLDSIAEAAVASFKYTLAGITESLRLEFTKRQKLRGFLLKLDCTRKT